MQPKIDIVIVNWNAGLQLRDCLQSVAEASHNGYALDRVVVVDNASKDGSADGLSFDNLPLLVIRNVENRGFAAACNQGARGSRADYVLFLNPDAQIERDSLTKVVKFMEDPRNDTVGICGIQLIDSEGQVSRSCARFPTAGQIAAHALGLDRVSGFFPSHFMSEWAHDTDREVDQVMGAFFFVRRRLFEALGGFDERFFVYYEEVDFALRAKQSGHRSFFLAQAQAFHRGCGTTDQVKATRLFYSLRSRLFFANKHFSLAQRVSVLVVTLAVEPWTRMVLGLLRGSVGQARETARAYISSYRALPSILGVGRKAAR